jgi:hypothetical protein
MKPPGSSYTYAYNSNASNVKGGDMKGSIVMLAVLATVGAASAQAPDTSKWMCRSLAQSGNYLYEGETIFGTQACRPIPETSQMVAGQTAFAYPPPAPQPEVRPATANSVSTVPISPDNANQPTTEASPTAKDGKKRLYVTDEQVDESVFISSHAAHGSSSGSLNGSWNQTGGSLNGNSQSSFTSAGAAYGHSERGANPRTVEVQADLYKACPEVVVTNDPRKADYLLLFRREGGKRSSMFAFGGLTGLAISSSMKVDGGSVFDTNGDLVFAARERSVGKVVKEACKHLQ